MLTFSNSTHEKAEVAVESGIDRQPFWTKQSESSQGDGFRFQNESKLYLYILNEMSAASGKRHRVLKKKSMKCCFELEKVAKYFCQMQGIQMKFIK